MYELQVSKEIASEFGELVADPKTGELLHYAEKPETFVSVLICIRCWESFCLD
jgi:mannose-1-phosphate guanylyltransferase